MLQADRQCKHHTHVRRLHDRIASQVRAPWQECCCDTRQAIQADYAALMSMFCKYMHQQDSSACHVSPACNSWRSDKASSINSIPARDTLTPTLAMAGHHFKVATAVQHVRPTPTVFHCIGCRLHLYSVVEQTSSAPDSVLTIATALNAVRLESLAEQCYSWPGQLVAALYHPVVRQVQDGGMELSLKEREELKALEKKARQTLQE